jgi:uncharacterized protein
VCARWRYRPKRARAAARLRYGHASRAKSPGQEERGTPQMKAPRRGVVDTNVVISALLFGGGPAARVRAGWQVGQFVPLASAATARELVRVLAYPRFRLAAGEQQVLLADYLPWVHVVAIPDPPSVVPPCRDPFDLPFLYLAIASRAHVLVSGDKDLLALADTRGLCRVLSVEAFCRQPAGACGMSIAQMRLGPGALCKGEMQVAVGGAARQFRSRSRKNLRKN